MMHPPASPSRRRLIIAGLVVGSLLTLAPLAGVGLTALGMMKAFHALGQDASGNTAELSAGVGQALVGTAAGLILFVPGVVILTISIIRMRRLNREAAVKGA